VAALGFADMGAYLADRVVGSRVSLAEIAAELGAHRLAARGLLDTTASTGCGVPLSSGRQVGLRCGPCGRQCRG
jgi:hypothetical protein